MSQEIQLPRGRPSAFITGQQANSGLVRNYDRTVTYLQGASKGMFTLLFYFYNTSSFPQFTNLRCNSSALLMRISLMNTTLTVKAMLKSHCEASLVVGLGRTRATLPAT